MTNPNFSPEPDAMKNERTRMMNAFHHDATPGVILILAMLAALVVANSGASWYGALLDTYGVIGIGEWDIKKPLLLWINDGLMAIFFLFVGLELKREVIFGALSDRRKITLPLIAAIGGVAIPALMYVAINWGDALAMDGWAIPAATDIAFALGVLALLGRRVPVALKVLLTSIAVIDDLMAILIIALFYTAQVSFLAHGFAFAFTVGLFLLNRAHVQAKAPYVVLGIALWIAVLKSGVHATLAGVTLAIFIPAGRDAADNTSMANRMEHGLHPWVIYLILPLFAFANAGVAILGLSFSDLLKPVPMGIAMGLFFGKQIGIFGASWLAVKCGLAQLPDGLNWKQMYSLAVLCGIGFTMSLFIGSLAFENDGSMEYVVDDRLGILVGSFLSAVVGAVLVYRTCPLPAAGQKG
ncbi:MAG: NhaA family Na+:H+ antiporter [Kiritimatiellia bacterium]|jgi:NhaA family Na+:H+ antiporter